ncbi:MAG TPA: hypothetical protein GYA10_09230 [Alphaproteobacteria bacterium]|nr:hypothetical protein [Alphaproteobacteria bacterium]
MTSYLLAGPAEEPVSLAEARAFLRLDDTAEDGLVQTLIAAARLHIEGTTARAMLRQSWRLVLDAWPANRDIRLPVGPLATVSALTVFDPAGDPQEVDFADFVIDRATPRLLLPASFAPPAMRERQGIEIDFVAGYGEEPADVPADLRQALLTLVAYWFEHRDTAHLAGAATVVPSGVERLVANYRRMAL